MTAAQAADRLAEMLALLRARAPEISRAQIVRYEGQVQGLIASLLERLPQTDRPEDLQGLLAALDDLLESIRAILLQHAAAAVRLLLDEIRKQFQEVHAAVFRDAGRDDRGALVLFAPLPARTEGRLVRLYGRGEGLATIAARGVDDAKQAGIGWLVAAAAAGLGVTGFRLLLKYLAGDLEEVPEWAPKDARPAQGMLARGRQVVASETFNAMREGVAAGAELSPLIKLGQWTLSPEHDFLPSSPDRCDEIAEFDAGFGPGWYDPRNWPAAPHPWCRCFMGKVTMVPRSEWEWSEPVLR